MIEALRGQRESISGLCGGADCVLELYHKAPMELDVACFGLDSAGRLSDEQYFVKYVEMRKNQKLVVEKLCQNIRLLHDVPIQAHAISHFIEDVSIKFHESNNTQELMQKLTEMQTSMQKEPLPVTRTEFENRAVLYRILYDLEELITIKKRFIETLTPDEIKRFWNTSQNCCQ